MRLFNCTTRQLSLTDEGRRQGSRPATAFTCWSRARCRHAAAGARGRGANVVRRGVWLDVLPLLPDFFQRYPQVRLG